MPELPEVETICRSLSAKLIGHQIIDIQVRDPRFRRRVDALKLHELIKNKCVESLSRRAKYLLIEMTDQTVLILHLGMSGRLLLLPEIEGFAKHDHVIFVLDNERHLRLRDSRRFGIVEAVKKSDLADYAPLRNLGIEPLSRQCNGLYLYERSRGLKKPVKNFLMDAHMVVGIGNIYASEALFLAGINPRRAAGKLSLASWQALAGAFKKVLRAAIAQGGTTLKDFMNSDGEAGDFQVRLRVYDRQGEGCVQCKKTIRRKVMAGRSTFYCPGCQA